MRNAFMDELIRYAEADERVILMVGDLGYSVIEPFAERFPDRFINAGVAEQNMIGVAAGMASEGCHVFVYSIGVFPTFRCAEQVRNDVDYHKLPVTVVSVGGGLAYGNLGYSHHAVQDYGLMRLLPNMLIAAPGDPMEARACMRYLATNPQPSYLRLGRGGEDCAHSTVPDIQPGKWLPVVGGGNGDATLLTTGTTLSLARKWLNSSIYEGFSVHSMPLWGMAHKSSQAEQVRSRSAIVTVEDHLADCGFGSWMHESLMGDSSELVGRVSVRALDSKVCGMVGSQRTLNHAGGLSDKPEM